MFIAKTLSICLYKRQLSMWQTVIYHFFYITHNQSHKKVEEKGQEKGVVLELLFAM